jgi:hypothetical protein
LTSPVYTTKFDDYSLLGCCSLSVLRAPSKAPSTHRTPPTIQRKHTTAARTQRFDREER